MQKSDKLFYRIKFRQANIQKPDKQNKLNQK